jgi:uncharacterized LabA/DUF88 family protein
LSQQARVNIAVFIDFDNIEIGVKTTLGEHFDIGTILEALKERGEVVTKIAYADWTRAGEYSRALTQHAIRLVQRNLTPGGDKNGADINLALDALEMAFTHPHINAYVIVGGDSDFLSLVEKLKQYDKKVFVVGGRAFTSVILQRNCHEFIAYENLVRKPSVRGGRPAASTASSPIAQAFPIVRRALKILADREVSPQTGLLKSTLLQLDSTFSERNYGASSFLDFVEKLSQAGLVTLKHSGRSVMVELNGGFGDGDGAGVGVGVGVLDTPARPDGASETPPEATAAPAADATAPPPPPPQAGDNAEGVRLAVQALAGAATARWPMYLRNAKQILRAANLDERRYGFGGLMDLLRACQRDGYVRLERDRRGGLRVFQGGALANVAGPARVMPRPSVLPQPDVMDELPPDVETIDAVPADAAPFAGRAAEPLDADTSDLSDFAEAQPVAVVDTTAELLGRAKPRKPRTRLAGAAGSASGEATRPRGTRKAGTKKTAGAARRPRSRKSVDSGE